jgi:hypothetical protein
MKHVATIIFILLALSSPATAATFTMQFMSHQNHAYTDEELQALKQALPSGWQIQFFSFPPAKVCTGNGICILKGTLKGKLLFVLFGKLKGSRVGRYFQFSFSGALERFKQCLRKFPPVTPRPKRTR